MVVERLPLSQLEIGLRIDPGIPALRASDSLVPALKSRNFGAQDYFEKAAEILAGSSAGQLPCVSSGHAGKRSAVTLASHGPVVAGKDITDAVRLALMMRRNPRGC